MTKQDLTNHLAYTLGLSHSEARSAVDLIFSSITEALIDGEDVKITDFASFRIVDKAPRNYRNQVTGEMEMSERGKRVKVSFSRKVTDAISGDQDFTTPGTLHTTASDEQEFSDAEE